ncbi:hypothetical protein J8M21_11495, partial [Pseudoalteromonas luteoviolacea]|uniref:hypothetical protein n=2 Tax=Pseudoalteromonas luteoviolacea TaxID=43657 RepID=UPI001B3A0CCE
RKRLEVQLFRKQGLSKPDSAWCEQVSIKFSDGTFEPSKVDSNETILIIDDEGINFSATLRYRSRVKSLYSIDDNGYYYKASKGGFDPEFKVPRIIKDTLNSIDNFTDPSGNHTFVPAAWLTDSLFPVVKSRYEYPFVGHGATPFHYLLEHNPESELIVVPMPKLHESRLDLFCNPTDNNISSLTAHIEDIAEDFKQTVLLQEDVEYLNYSGGYEIERVIAMTWKQYCLSPLPSEETLAALHNTVRPFYDVLFNTSGVMAFQASGINMTAYNNELDIDKSYQNRLLVAPFTVLDTKLPANGEINGNAPELDASIYNSKQWIDVMVNLGITPIRPFPFNETPAMATTSLGLSYTPFSDSSTSWSSPIALSTALYIKNVKYDELQLDDIVIEQIKNDMTPQLCHYNNWEIIDYEGKCKMQDPLLHRRHNLFELGYVD